MTRPRRAGGIARRVPAPRATGLRRPPVRLGPPRARRRRAGAGIAAILAALLAALALWLLLRRDPPPPSPAPRPAAVAAVARPVPGPPARSKAPPPPPATPSPRDRLLAAIRDRAGDLESCQAAPGSPTRAPVRLRIGKDGAARALSIEGARPLPGPLAACLRERILAWSFPGLGLASDVEVLVTFRLAPASGT